MTSEMTKAFALSGKNWRRGPTLVFDKTIVVKALRHMSAFLQLKGENAFKTRAYDIAADRIAGLNEDLALVVSQKRLTSLPGVGESIAAKIAELVTTGRLEALEALKAEFSPTILELLTVQDLGPKKAATLYKELKVGSLAELEQACRDGRIRALKGFGQKSEEKFLAGIELAKRQAQAGERKRLGSVLESAEAVLAWVKQAPGVQRASLGGSVRRFRETVADVDIIASAADPAPVFAHFLKWPQIAAVIGQGESKASIRLVENDLQIDLRVLPDVDFATALHHFTGSKAHHIRLRGHANTLGMTLSEWGLFKDDQKISVATEEALYERLGLQPVPPELREDWGEFEAALERRLPTDLVTRADIVGNVHAHSSWSDGRNSLEEMALAAKALGMKYFTVTEHSETAGYAQGLNLDRIKHQWDEIDALNERLKGITLLKGIESDILEDGRLDYPDSVLEQFDVVICSIHQRYSQDEAAMTRRVLNAMENPFFHIWGHPTGRLLLKRDPAPMRMEVVLDKAAEKGIIVEVNGCPERLDLSAELVRQALSRGLKLSVSTDAHSIDELSQHLNFAVGTARKGWARVGDVVNAFDLKQFRKALRH